MRRLFCTLCMLLALLSCNSWARGITVVPSVAVGGVSEGNRLPNAMGRLGLSLRGPLWRRLSWQGGAAWARYHIDYFGLPEQVVLSNSTGVVSAVRQPTWENKFDLWVGASLLLRKAPWGLSFQTGYRQVFLDNSVSSFRFGGPRVGLRLREGPFAVLGGVTPAVFRHVDNHGPSSLQPLTASGSTSLFGAPLVSVDYSIRWWSGLHHGLHFGLGYEGEAIAFEGDVRYYNMLSLAVLLH